MNELGKIAEIAIPLWVVFSYMVFMCMVQALPRPAEGKSSPFYVWVYQFAHLLCMNLSLVFDPEKKLKLDTTTETTTLTNVTVRTAPEPKKEP